VDIVMATVLIVDDELFVLEEMAEALEDEGYRVLSAANMREALDFLAAQGAANIDLLVTDLKMPGGSGIDLYLRAKALHGTLPPAILLSGHGAESNRIEAMAAGFSECQAKPIDIDSFLCVVARLCAG